ncbi:MAG TPA: response regulator [Bacteroidia bacterium]|nr:response regulator [Bacteroidia bacterium]
MTSIQSFYKYKTVILIDDNDIDNFVNQTMLVTSRFAETIHVRLNGEIALELINTLTEDNYPDIVFVDLNMPVMNGFEFIQNFKTINDQKQVKARIVVLTSSIHQEDKLNVEKIDDNILFVRKPLSSQVLTDL